MQKPIDGECKRPQKRWKMPSSLGEKKKKKNGGGKVRGKRGSASISSISSMSSGTASNSKRSRKKGKLVDIPVHRWVYR